MPWLEKMGRESPPLIKIITGAYNPDEGFIEINGQQYKGLHPAQARQLGISAVYQEFNLLPDASIAENIFLTNPPTGRLGLIDIAERARQASELLEAIGSASNYLIRTN